MKTTKETENKSEEIVIKLNKAKIFGGIRKGLIPGFIMVLLANSCHQQIQLIDLRKDNNNQLGIIANHKFYIENLIAMGLAHGLIGFSNSSAASNVIVIPPTNNPLPLVESIVKKTNGPTRPHKPSE
jgi:hypothetical protein